MRVNFAKSLIFAPDQLKDGYLAFAMALSDNKNLQINQSAEISHEKRGSRALQVLAKLESPSLDDARTALCLALMLITYNDLMAGAPTLPITRSALLLAAPWRGKLMGRTIEDMEPSIICVLFAEMFECIVLGQIPVFQYNPPKGNTIVDRYYGICHELLPHFYDVCMLYVLIKKGMITQDEKANKMRHLTSSIDQWVPETVMEQRQDIVTDQSEKEHFLRQARCFKATLQLLVLQAHRSSVTDMLASSKASQIETEIFHASYQGLGKPNYMTFSFFVSCLELYRYDTIDTTNILDTLERISNGIAPKSCRSMLAGLTHILHNRQNYPDLTWFECVEDGLKLAIGP